MVFSQFERKAEDTRCMVAKDEVKFKKADFGQKYFYIFGLNKKFCKGIQIYASKLSEKQITHQKGSWHRLSA